MSLRKGNPVAKQVLVVLVLGSRRTLRKAVGKDRQKAKAKAKAVVVSRLAMGLREQLVGNVAGFKLRMASWSARAIGNVVVQIASGRWKGSSIGHPIFFVFTAIRPRTKPSCPSFWRGDRR